ncbi:DUF2934 domain-containing protein [Paludibaculum fermentans]|uniref:DUF2934 domain-containing protein n=1 Tax=Paludibaculum fermentans TaxID=1473598 RepID=UPI003EB84E24
MSTNQLNASVRQQHQQAAEIHTRAAQAHLAAADSRENQAPQTGQKRSSQALEHSQQAYNRTGRLHLDGVPGDGPGGFNHQQVAILAHSLWEARGCPYGSPDDDWFRAAQQLHDRAGIRAT